MNILTNVSDHVNAYELRHVYRSYEHFDIDFVLYTNTWHQFKHNFCKSTSLFSDMSIRHFYNYNDIYKEFCFEHNALPALYPDGHLRENYFDQELLAKSINFRDHFINLQEFYYKHLAEYTYRRIQTMHSKARGQEIDLLNLRIKNKHQKELICRYYASLAAIWVEMSNATLNLFDKKEDRYFIFKKLNDMQEDYMKKLYSQDDMFFTPFCTCEMYKRRYDDTFSEEDKEEYVPSPVFLRGGLKKMKKN
jgi:hypothetical protein